LPALPPATPSGFTMPSVRVGVAKVESLRVCV
jgi:hypothetical protein